MKCAPSTARARGPPARTTATAERFNSAPVIRCDPPFPLPILENTRGPLENTDGPVSTCWAEDAEGDKVSWEWTGPDTSWFGFRNRKVTLKQPLDYEDPLDADGDNTYQLHLIARDTRDQTLADTLAVTVWLLNEDEPPTLYGQSQRSILENRTGFVASYYADDPEDEDLTWSLSGPDHHLFGLTPTGAKNKFALLTLEHALNFESELDANEDNLYELYVEVSDTGHQTQLAVYVRVAHQVGKDVAVQVLDENEPPSILGARQFSFPENATGELETYYALDPEGSTIHWSLGDNDGPFSIDAKSGRLRVQDEMDYEAIEADAHNERTYSFRVIATDEHPKGSLSSDIAVIVKVLDVNEPPVLSGPAQVDVYENSSYVATYTAEDPEGKPITWSVNNNTFSIDSVGRLSFVSTPNIDRDTSYSVTVRASDPAGLYAEQSVTVVVINIEDSPPEQVLTDTPGQDDVGQILLRPSPPREEEAVTATLLDVDGVLADSTVTWTWTVDGNLVSTSSGTGQTTSSYTPTATDVGQSLTVEVSYYDEEGTDEDTASATSEAVVAKDTPSPPVAGTCDQPSSLALTPSTPRVGDILTGTLTDADGGLRNVYWGFGSQPRQARGTNPRAQPNITRMESSVLVQLGWLGQQVRVLVFYDDACGSGKSLETHSGTVQPGRPEAPGSLTATTGSVYTQVDLSWSAAADNGSTITDYQYQYRKSGASS